MRVFKHTHTLVLIIFILISINTLGQKIALTVICNQNDSFSNMKFGELKSVFKYTKKKLCNGNPVKLTIMSPGTEIGKYTCDIVYNLSPNELMMSFLKMTNMGTKSHPRILRSVSEIQDYVSNNPCTLAIIDQSPLIPGVKIVLIDGKKTLPDL